MYYFHVRTKKDLNFVILIASGAITTLIITPNLNKDSMVIPKLIFLFGTAVFFLPTVVRSWISIKEFKYLKQFFYLSFILTFLSIAILVNSDSPIEQLLYGRSGRGLGYITFFSSLVLMLISSLLISLHNLRVLIAGLAISGIVTCVYAVFQFFGLDFFNWDTKTNGIVSTLGNPNFQSSFAAMVFWPLIIFIYKYKYKYINIFFAVMLIFATIYVSKSTQGYIGISVAILVFSLIFFWYRLRVIAFIVGILTVSIGVIAIFGMLGHGPLSQYLYKISVQSRGDFWRSAFATGNSNPIFGVGFDSFGDYFLMHRDSIAASHDFAEYTDSAHNYFLDYLVNGGYPFLIINILLILLVLRTFYLNQRVVAKFDSNLAALFCAWIIFLLQSIISPIGIPFLIWNSIISGSVIGLASIRMNSQELSLIPDMKFKLKSSQFLFLVFGLIILFPYYNSDRMQLEAMQTGDGDLLIKAVTSYPESVLKYNQAGRDLLTSGLPEQSLFIARKAVEFNPNSAALWSIILANPIAPVEERNVAKQIILKLDPLNSKVRNLEIK